jgi:osmoprotectant transport system ATP-binding protein
MIALNKISFSYKTTLILNEVTHQFQDEKYHIILGPSGSGKSTLLKLIAGFLRPQVGEITPLSSYGFVLQEGGLFPHLNVAQNMSIQGIDLHWDAHRLRTRIQELCELTRVSSDLLAKYPNEISGGQKQRVALMRALFLDPNVLLFDESLNGLDPLLKYSLMEDLLDIIRKLKKTVLHVTHDLLEASVLGDEILLLNDGRIEEASEKSIFFKYPVSSFTKKYIQSQKVAL